MKRIPLDTDNLIRRYLSGEAINAIAKDMQCSNKSIRNRLAEANIPLRGTPPRRPDIPVQDIVTRYQAGESELAISLALGLNRQTITRHLTRAGIQRRGVSEANLIRMQSMSDEERQELTKAAHEAVRGKKLTKAQSIRNAKIREIWHNQRGTFEVELESWLADRGHVLTPQFAVDRYNIDLAIPPVAVEVHWRSHNPVTLPATKERIEYLTNRGWSVIYVWVTRTQVLDERAADQVASLIELSRRDPSTRGQYWVVRSRGELSATGRTDDDDWPIVSTPKRAA